MGIAPSKTSSPNTTSPQNHRPSEAATILESDLNRADVGNRSPAPIRKDDLPLLKGLDLQLNRQVLWNTKVDSPRIRQRRDLNRMEVRAGRIQQLDAPANQPHSSHHAGN